MLAAFIIFLFSYGVAPAMAYDIGTVENSKYSHTLTTDAHFDKIVEKKSKK